VEELEACLRSVDDKDAFVKAMLNLYREFSAHADAAAGSAIAEGEGLAGADASGAVAVVSATSPVLDEQERLKKLGSWHDNAPDPEVYGIWNVVDWRETVGLARKGEGIWSKEFFLAGRLGVRLGVYAKGCKASRDGTIGVLISSREGDRMDATIEVGGVEKSKTLSFGKGTSGVSTAGWPNFASAGELKLESDGSLEVILKIK